jgi:hypothetical protein
MSSLLVVARSAIRRKWRHLIVVGVALGVVLGASFTAAAGARRSGSALVRMRRETLAADLTVQLGAPVEGLLDDVVRSPGVAGAGEVFAFVGVAGANGDGPNVNIFAPADDGFLREVDRPRLLEGRLADPGRDDEVTLGRASAELLGVDVGATIDLVTLTPDQFDALQTGEFSGFGGPRLRLHVVGITQISDEISEPARMATAIATPAFFSSYSGRAAGFGGTARVRLVDGADGVGAFEDNLRQTLGSGPDVALTAAKDVDRPTTRALAALSVGLGLFAMVAGAAGLAAGAQAISRVLAEVADDHAALPAIGMRRRRLADVYPLVAGPTVLVAIATAAVVAVAASPLMPIGLARTIEPSPGLDIDATVLLAGSAAVAIALGGWSWLVGARLSRRGSAAGALGLRRPSTVASLLRGAGAGPGTTTGVEMALEPGRGRRSVPVRSALAGAAVALLGAAAAGVVGVSLHRLVSTPARYGFAGDLISTDAGIDQLQEPIRAAAALPDVRADAAIGFSLATIDGHTAEAYALLSEPAAPMLTVLSGHLPSAPDEVAVGPRFVGGDGKHVAIGDTIDAAPVDGSAALTLRVVGTVLVPGYDNDPIAGGVVVTRATYERIRPDAGRTLLAVDLAPGAGADAPEQVSAATSLEYTGPTPPGDVANLDQLRNLPAVIALTVVLVGVAALTHTVLVAMRRRRRELATLRVVGFAYRQVRTNAFGQVGTYLAFALVVGVPLGIVVGRVVWRGLAGDIGVANDPATPWTVLLAIAPAAVVTAVLLAVPLARAAARRPPAIGLRAE